MKLVERISRFVGNTDVFRRNTGPVNDVQHKTHEQISTVTSARLESTNRPTEIPIYATYQGNINQKLLEIQSRNAASLRRRIQARQKARFAKTPPPLTVINTPDCHLYGSRLVGA